MKSAETAKKVLDYAAKDGATFSRWETLIVYRTIGESAFALEEVTDILKHCDSSREAIEHISRLLLSDPVMGGIRAQLAGESAKSHEPFFYYEDVSFKELTRALSTRMEARDTQVSSHQ